ncbi:unnamed protein product [Arabidopsis lyrata]|nr:unnamed protein product [Arabidopsis lyrata]
MATSLYVKLMGLDLAHEMMFRVLKMEESWRRRRSLSYCKLNHVTKLIDEKESGNADDVEILEPCLKFFKPEGDESDVSKEADRVILTLKVILWFL